MEHCQKLREYAQFVAEVRKRLDRGALLEEAADEAVSHCIREGVLSEFLIAHRAEVNEVILTEYDEQFHIASEKELSRKEGVELGRREGKEEGRREGIKVLIETLAEMGSPKSEIASKLQERFGLSSEEAETYINDIFPDSD